LTNPLRCNKFILLLEYYLDRVYYHSGSKVSDTIRKGIIDVEPYENNTELLMAGNIAALSGKLLQSM